MDLMSTNWDKVYNTVSCDEAFSIFSVRLEELTKKNTVVCRTKYNVRKPWFANPFLKRFKEKKKLWNKFKVMSLQAVFEQHRRSSNKLKSDLKAARVKYENNLSKTNSLQN